MHARGHARGLCVWTARGADGPILTRRRWCGSRVAISSRPGDEAKLSPMSPPAEGTQSDRSDTLGEPRRVTYEKRLDRDARWALIEGSRFFERQGSVHEALRKITARLDELGIPYAVADGMALFEHGYRRFTEDIDILVTQRDLKMIHEKLEGRGYLPPFERAKNLRDTELGVRIEFLVAGQFPGDGKPKPIAFPDPSEVAELRAGIRCLNLPTLIELKLASGMTDPGRQKDLADAIELIKILDLPEDFAGKLHAFVRGKYAELWRAARPARKRYESIWRNKFLTLDASSIEDMIASLRDASIRLEAMRADGVQIDPADGTGDDYATLFTYDPAIAKKYDFHPEEDFLDESEYQGRDDDRNDEEK